MNQTPSSSLAKPVEVAIPCAPDRGITKVWELRKTLDRPCDDLVERVLLSRNIESDSDGDKFLNPSLKMMHDPSEIPDLDKAANRILDAIHKDEQIVIYGDYDVDGMTASSILIHIIRALDSDNQVRSYVPHRLDEGYGIHSDAIRNLVEDGAQLIISVDCGITAIEPALVAKKLCVDLIITDHHNPPESLEDMPEAFAVVHPRRPDSKYPFGELCGAGVAYKLAWRLATLHAGREKVSPYLRTVLIDLLGFAALGTIADIVPLVDENRAIVKHGLSQIPKSPNEGIQALIQASGLDSSKVDTEDVGFRLAPRLNAIGRLGHSAEAVELLTEATGQRAIELAENLSRMNEQRKAQESAIVSKAVEIVEQSGLIEKGVKAIVLADEDWHPGIVGIVCSRLVDRFARPTILMQRENGMCKGSGRSIEGFNLHAGLEASSNHLLSFGGHDMAAGMKCDETQFEEFAQSFMSYADTKLNENDLVHRTRYDCVAGFEELTNESIRRLDKIAPFGAGNSRVRLRINRLKLNGDASPFGKTGNHLSLRVGSIDNPGICVRVVAWNWARHLVHIPASAPIEMIIEPVLSTWNGKTRIEPVLVDMRVV
ncbi:MAG: single-stranded-DNA-specific exonuclease RecJ [Phycisphaerales bacterium]|nr:single-stranded-DNA-specific exonuclease RecJ [Phycisphaerales bacterium]